jgi:uncharacterized Rmd1/YagE family protein
MTGSVPSMANTKAELFKHIESLSENEYNEFCKSSLKDEDTEKSDREVQKLLIDSIALFTGDSFDFQHLNEFWIQFDRLFAKKLFDGQQEINLVSTKLNGPALVWFSPTNPTPRCWFELNPC